MLHNLEVLVGQLTKLTLASTIFDGMEGSQGLDEVLVQIKHETFAGKHPGFQVTKDRIFSFKGQLCVPDDDELRGDIFSEAYNTTYSVLPSAIKMYKDLKENF